MGEGSLNMVLEVLLLFYVVTILRKLSLILVRYHQNSLPDFSHISLFFFLSFVTSLILSLSDTKKVFVFASRQ